MNRSLGMDADYYPETFCSAHIALLSCTCAVSCEFRDGDEYLLLSRIFKRTEHLARESNMIGSVIMVNISPQFLAGHLYKLPPSNRSYPSYH